MFDINDLYSVSGGVTVFNYWNPFVTKHDTSSFYNWEQDNLPLYDLEERTHYLWEKFGYPLSSVPGMAYVVSASIPDIEASSNVFTSVSAAIEALPEIIRMPTLIEVAVSGNMGELNLNNIKCEDDGVLEIVNRIYGDVTNNSYQMYLSSTTDVFETPQVNVPSVMSSTSTALVGTLSSTSAISLSANASSVLVGWDPAIKTDDVRNFILAGRGNEQVGSNYTVPGYLNVGVGGNASTWYNSNKNYMYTNTITPTAGNPLQSRAADATITTLDLSTTREYDSTIIHPPIFTDTQLAKGIWAGNYFSKIRVQNCDGPIYIRNFIVDGKSSTDTGIGVYNTNGLTLESCGAMRNTTTGFDIKNSAVDLRRQAFAGRNYDVANRGALKTYGFKLTDSDVSFVTDTYVSGGAASFASHFHDYGIYMQNSVLMGGDVLGTTQEEAFYTDLGSNKTGLYCSNSKYSMNGVTNVYMSYNNIEAKNSVVEVEQLRNTFCQNIGLLMDNSNFRYNKNLNPNASGGPTTAENSEAPIYHDYPILFSKNGQNIVLRGGSTYTPTYPVGSSGVDMTTLYGQEVYYDHHGMVSGLDTAKTGVIVDNSLAEFTCGKFSSPGPVATTNKIPRHLLVTNNGNAIVRGLGGTFTNYPNRNPVCYFDGPMRTASTAILADNNSNIYLTGPVAVYNNGIGIAAINSSKIQTSPPLDNTHSFTDVWDGNLTYNYSLSGWGAGVFSAPTVLEIHSQGGCLIADNKSELILEDMGDFSGFWGDTYTSSVDYVATNWGADSVASAGAMQFYPNADTDNDIMEYTLPTTNFSGVDILNGTEYSNRLNEDSSVSCYRILYNKEYDTATAGDEFREVAHGGMCVKAANDSSVKVRNVHFPMGHAPADWSYYDASASPAGCSHLLIWNIADISQLHASYCTVSGQYPLHAGYVGPRSFYTLSRGVLGAGQDSSAVAYDVPSGTPHTGKLSVLDHYGSAVEVSSAYTYALPEPLCASDTSCVAKAMGITPLSSTRGFMSLLQEKRTGITSDDTYGAADFQNRGPFRLYFSVLPAAKKLFYLSGVDGAPGELMPNYASDNRPYQHLSQGYLLQSNCSANVEFSGLFPQILCKHTYNTSGIITTSGYYYPEDLMPKERASVWLEKSASNLFSNAKHCNTDYSNRIKLVNIYDSKIHSWGGSFVGDASGGGLGFRNSNAFDIERKL